LQTRADRSVLPVLCRRRLSATTRLSLLTLTKSMSFNRHPPQKPGNDEVLSFRRKFYEFAKHTLFLPEIDNAYIILLFF
jgi:hypothetical protein